MGVNAATSREISLSKKQSSGNANDFPEPWDEVPVEEFLGDEEGDDETTYIDRREEDEEW